MKNRFAVLLIIICSFLSGVSVAQSTENESEIDAYKQEIEKLISFVQYIFNALGSQDLSVRDKDVIVNSSYLKAFQNKEVQVEDDLISGRQVVTNKDVQAYLKDIDFFFENAKFDLRIEEIREGINEQGNLFFRVKLNRNLQATTIEGDSVNNNLTRYVEVNLDKKNKDLRIASIYTTKIAEKEELVHWWTSLTPAWKNILGEAIIAYDNFKLSEVSIVNDSSYAFGGMIFTEKDLDISKAIKKAANIEKLDISNHKEIVDVEPLSGMTELKELNISGTSVSSLFPLRNLNSLEKLNCSYTTIENLDPLIYCIRLTNLNISNTNIIDLAPLANLKQLEVFTANNLVTSSTHVLSSLSALTSVSLENNTALRSLDLTKDLTHLTYLNVSGTGISDLEPLKPLAELKTLDISKTLVTSLQPLSTLKGLENISMLNTSISSLVPLTDTSVKQIFCEGSLVDRQEIIDFLKEKPECEVIFQTKDLEAWWKAIPENWKKLVFNKVKFDGDPTPEILHKIIKIDTINISGHTEIDNLQPLEKLLVLKKLDCSNTSISSLRPLEGQTSLEELDFSNTNVSDIASLKNMSNLKHVDGSHTNVEHIEVFEGFSKLETVNFDYTNVQNLRIISSLPAFRVGYFDSTKVTDEDVIDLIYKNEDAVVIYKTEHLREWWGHLTDEWQDMFRKTMEFSKRPTREEIHRLAGLQNFTVKSILVKDISPMAEFIRLKELKFNDTQISDISPLSTMKKLEVLDCSRNPVTTLGPLAELRSLKVLYADNTQIEEIDPLANLILLEELKFSGTEVKDLDPLEKLVNLKVLEFSNTRVKNIKPIMGLFQLKELKCYNNSINSKRIDEFKEQHPDCEVVFY